MKFKKFFSSCSPSVSRKRLEDANDSKYVNLRPLTKQHASVPDFVHVNGNRHSQSINDLQKVNAVPTGSGSGSRNYQPVQQGYDAATASYKPGGKPVKAHPRMKQSKSTSQFYVKNTEEMFSRPSPVDPVMEAARTEPVTNTGLRIGDRVIWAREETGRCEGGTVRWLGIIEDEEIAGIEFDFPLNLGSGWYQNRKLFDCAKHHGGLVAVAGLILEEDFLNTDPIPSNRRGGLSQRSSVVGLPTFPEDNFLRAGPVSSHGSVSDRRSQSNLDAVPLGYNRYDDSLLHCFSASTSALSPSYPKSWTSVQSRTSSMSRVPYVQPTLKEEDAERLSGRNKGVQGNRNSCYLDATLFSMFAFTSAFDPILMRKCRDDLATKVQGILREDVVNKLRKDLFVSAEHVMNIRKMMEHLDDKMTSAEMDPAEFLQYLFKEVLRIPEFIKLSSNESDYFHQVLVQPSEADNCRVPTVQELFEKSLIMQQLKLTEIPCPALILQMPRSGNNYKMYSGIFPNLTIDITDLMENTPRMCVICGALAVWECQDCYGKFRDPSTDYPLYSGAESTSFCETCVEQTHKKKVEVQEHRKRWNRIDYSPEVMKYFHQQPLIPFPNNNQYPDRNYHRYRNSIPRVKMDLVAVICIETSHFVSFVKCGTDRKAPWAFFDSMADRVENANGGGHNIPHVKLLPQFGEWLHTLEHDTQELVRNFSEYTPDMKRFLSDAYICIYCSPSANLYR